MVLLTSPDQFDLMKFFIEKFLAVAIIAVFSVRLFFILFSLAFHSKPPLSCSLFILSARDSYHYAASPSPIDFSVKIPSSNGGLSQLVVFGQEYFPLHLSGAIKYWDLSFVLLFCLSLFLSDFNFKSP